MKFPGLRTLVWPADSFFDQLARIEFSSSSIAGPLVRRDHVPACGGAQGDLALPARRRRADLRPAQSPEPVRMGQPGPHHGSSASPLRPRQTDPRQSLRAADRRAGGCRGGVAVFAIVGATRRVAPTRFI